MSYKDIESETYMDCEIGLLLRVSQWNYINCVCMLNNYYCLIIITI